MRLADFVLEDVSDNATMFDPPLMRIRQPIEELAGRAVSLILDGSHKDLPNRHTVHPPSQLVRKSTRPCTLREV